MDNTMTIEEKAAEKAVETKKKFDLSSFAPTTRRMIVLCLGCIGVAAVVGMSFGKIPVQDGMVLGVSISSGFLGLLKGGN